MPDDTPPQANSPPQSTNGTLVRRQPSAPPQPLTLQGLLEYVRECFALLRDEVADAQQVATDARALVGAMGERRTADIRRMIDEVVGERLTTFSAEIHALVDPLAATVGDSAELLEFVRRQKATERARLASAILRERQRVASDARWDGYIADSRNSAACIALLLAWFQLRSTLSTPPAFFWPVAALLVLIAVVYPFYRNLLRPLWRPLGILPPATDEPDESAHEIGDVMP